MKFLDVIVVKVEVVDGETAVEHVGRNCGNKVFSQIKFVQAFPVAEGSFWNCFNVVSSYLEPCQAGQGLDGLEREGSELVVAEAEGVDGGGEAVRDDVSDVVVVKVQIQQSLEGAEEVTRDVGDLILTEKETCQAVTKVEVVTVRQIHDLIPENKRYLQFLLTAQGSF